MLTESFTGIRKIHRITNEKTWILVRLIQIIQQVDQVLEADMSGVSIESLKRIRIRTIQLAHTLEEGTPANIKEHAGLLFDEIEELLFNHYEYFTVRKTENFITGYSKCEDESSDDEKNIYKLLLRIRSAAYFNMFDRQSSGDKIKFVTSLIDVSRELKNCIINSSKLKTKRSTSRGEAYEKIIAALNAHHQYDNGSCMNWEPIGNNELARQAGVSNSTVSSFFKKEFKSILMYKRQCMENLPLIQSLMLLNDEYSPHHLYGRNLPGEDLNDED